MALTLGSLPKAVLKNRVRRLLRFTQKKMDNICPAGSFRSSKGKTNKISSESFLLEFSNQTAQREKTSKNTSDLTLERKYSTAVLRVCSDNRLLHPGYVVTKHVTSKTGRQADLNIKTAFCSLSTADTPLSESVPLPTIST